MTAPDQAAPFGGLSIDFSADTSVAAPAAPAPLGGLSIAFAPDAAPAPGGPGTSADGAGRTESKLVIVGSGPAGLTAAIYAARANLEPIVLAGSAPGGQLMLTSDVENYPGFPDGIQGPELMAAFRAQAERFGTRIVDVDVDRVDLSSRPFRLWARGTEYRAESVIVATGASAMWLGLESETRLRGRGVSACATCDGFFFKDREIAVVGGGDTAFEEAAYLTRFASKVHLLHRRDEFRASRIMVERARANPKIEIHTNTGIDEVLGEAKVEALALRDTVTGQAQTMPIEGLFIAIGHQPNTEAFRDWLEVDAKGYLVIHDQTHSRIDGVFIAGDVHDHRYRQAITAAADGCKAAIDAERWLEAQGITEANTLTAW
ncbi:MAG TPA: thioredoxin-disulfide reductase [Candidatus Sulfomarinibacteraceae bacterium]|nr:thioredoxin-disulfide reductase [Candidatus Sulfomarinibacteraceae bacterium]